MPPEAAARFSVLFVCLGNICRSPMAGAVFAHIVKSRGLDARFDRIESAGTSGWHDGEEPDERTVATCKKHGVAIDSTAQTVKKSDFQTYLTRSQTSFTSPIYEETDYILAMDQNNLKNLQSMRPPGSQARVELFGAFGDNRAIQDPYYGSKDGFERCYNQILEYSDGLLADMGLAKNNA